MGELKPGWKRVKFGEVVRLGKERCADPAADGITRYIGLEHLEPGDLRIRSWGDIAEGTTFTTRVRPGQVLFGKRRAYQRKVAVADFDAVCSGDIYVFESIDSKRLLPELLPFLCQTDSFFEYAIGTSAGSLSPRTNWTSLAEYEFALPTPREQRRLTQVLRAAGSAVWLLEAALRAHHALSTAHSNALLLSASERGAITTTLGKVAKRLGVGIAASASHAYRDAGVPFLRNTNIKAGRIDTSNLLYVDATYAERHKSKRLAQGDVVMTRTATDVPGDAVVVPPELDGAQAFTILVCTPDETVLDSFYLCRWINGAPGRSFIRTRRGGAKQQNLGATFLAEMPIRLPPLSRQRDLVARLQELDGVGVRLTKRLQVARTLARAIQDQGFGFHP